jgi:hypothetical protein
MSCFAGACVAEGFALNRSRCGGCDWFFDRMTGFPASRVHTCRVCRRVVRLGMTLVIALKGRDMVRCDNSLGLRGLSWCFALTPCLHTLSLTPCPHTLSPHLVSTLCRLKRGRGGRGRERTIRIPPALHAYPLSSGDNATRPLHPFPPQSIIRSSIQGCQHELSCP